jgi:hypothetical protein
MRTISSRKPVYWRHPCSRHPRPPRPPARLAQEGDRLLERDVRGVLPAAGPLPGGRVGRLPRRAPPATAGHLPVCRCIFLTASAYWTALSMPEGLAVRA